MTDKKGRTMNETMTIEMRDVADIVPTPWNPPVRVTDSAVQSLLQDIRERGVLSPITFGCDGVLADGNRRLACARKLGITQLPCVTSSFPAVEIYGPENVTRENLNGPQWLHVYLSEPRAVPPKQRGYLVAIERLLGRAALLLLKDNGLGWSLYNDVMWLVRYCGREENPATVWTALNWAVKHKAAYYIRTVREARPRPLSVWRLVEQDKKPPKLGRKIDA